MQMLKSDQTNYLLLDAKKFYENGYNGEKDEK